MVKITTLINNSNNRYLNFKNIKDQYRMPESDIQKEGYDESDKVYPEIYAGSTAV